MKVSNVISARTDNPAVPTTSAESSSSIDRFTLKGPSAKLDPLYDAYRGDLADVALASRLFAPHYARPLILECGPDVATMKARPSDDADDLGLLSPGEAFAMLDETGGWAWGYRTGDHLVGYVGRDRLT